MRALRFIRTARVSGRRFANNRSAESRTRTWNSRQLIRTIAVNTQTFSVNSEPLPTPVQFNFDEDDDGT